MNPPGRDPSAADPQRRRVIRRPQNPQPPEETNYSGEQSPTEYDGTGPTTALPRPTSYPPRQQPLGEQPTTALPRRPSGSSTPAGQRPPLPRSFLNKDPRQDSGPGQSHGPRSGQYPRTGPASRSSYPGPTDNRYQRVTDDPAYPDPAYPDPAYPSSGSPDSRYPRYGYAPRPDSGYQPGYSDPPHGSRGRSTGGTRYPAEPPEHYPADPGSYQSRYGGRPGSPDYERDQQPLDATDYRPPPRGAHLPPYREPLPELEMETADAAPSDTTQAMPGRAPKTPRKLTVTRVAAMRSRELTLRGVDIFQKATTADGADRSGLAHLTYAVMANYATDAALVVALANTLFLVDPQQGVWRVLLYLVITVAPFAFIAPVIGPFLDRLQTGRRMALAASMVGRGIFALLMIFTFTGAEASWALYPCALGSLVLSKSFGVLKASLTPRVLPEAITLVKTNSRLTVFGLIAGGVAGGIAGLFTWAFGSTGALAFTAVVGCAGAVLCLKIPAWVESTEGEVPVGNVEVRRQPRSGPSPVSQSVRTTLWANSLIRVETGFLAMFIAFVVMKEYDDKTGIVKLLLLGIVGVAAGLGGFLGNALGAKLPLRNPEMISLTGGLVTLTATILAAFLPGLMTAALVALVGSTASSLSKVCLDSVIQRDLAEVSRASAFGRSETALQLAWVFGGVVGLLLGGLLNLPHDSVYTIGFVTVSLLLVLGMVQTWMVKGGRTMVPTIPWPWRREKAAAQPPRSDRTTATTAYQQPDAYYPSQSRSAGPTEAPTKVSRSVSGQRSGKGAPTRRSGGASRFPKKAKDRRSGEPLQ